MSIENAIKKKIFDYKKGKIFFPSHFLQIGSSAAIRQALKRLEKEGILIRLAHGIYLYPKKHPILGELYPSTDEIAMAIAKRDKARIIPTGIHALNKLGLSTQVPLNVVYLTDGSSRSIRLKNGSVKFKKSSPKFLSAKSDEFILVVQALKELGQDNITSQVKKKIQDVLDTLDEDLIRHDIKLAPQWIQVIVNELLLTHE